MSHYSHGDFAVIIRHNDPAYKDAVCRVYAMAEDGFGDLSVILFPLSVMLDQVTVPAKDVRPAKTAEVLIYRKAGLT